MFISCWPLFVVVSFAQFFSLPSQNLDSESDILENECFQDRDHFENCINIVVTNVTAILNSSNEEKDDILSKRKALLFAYEEEICEADGSKAQVKDVLLWSSKEGDLIAEGKLSTSVQLQSPIKIKTTMHRNILGLWIKMGCLKDYFGSCDFQDACEYGIPGETEAECPSLLQELDLPCRCPIEPGEYLLPGMQFKMPATYWTWILSGRYTLAAEVSDATGAISCYKASFELV